MSSIHNIILALKTYIVRENAPYAIIINGAWGSGKTYLVKKILIPSLEKNSSIYISLFGLKSIQEIENEIFKSLSLISDDKQGLFKGLLNANPEKIDEIKIGGIGYAVQILLNEWKKNRIQKGKSRVLFFDDLERWEGDICVCLSYINKLVEQNSSKCILIGNIEEIKDSNKEGFYKTREKTIRRIFSLDKSSSSVIEISLNLVSYTNSSVEDYIRKLLQDNLSRISEILDRTSYQNIRVVSESLQLLDEIISKNMEKFQISLTSAISYYCALLSTLILFDKYIENSEIKSKILNYGNNQINNAQLLEDLGYFDEQNKSIKVPDGLSHVVSSIFYRSKHIVSLNGIFSIVKSGCYYQEDFNGSFDNWVASKAYEYYQDNFLFHSMPDDKANRLVMETLNELFEQKIVTNPISLLLITDRLTSDIKRGSIDLDFKKTKNRIIHLFKDLYQSEKMDLEKHVDLRYGSNSFHYCQDIFDQVKEMNSEYISQISYKNISKIWGRIREETENIKELLHEVEKDPIFSIYDDPQDILDVLYNLTNQQLLEFTSWMGNRIENLAYQKAVNEEKQKATVVANLILDDYSGVYTVRAGHFKQIARILLNHSVDYDPEYSD